MFESDDWDLDQDFLNDVDEKAIKYCSQKADELHIAKKRKIEEIGGFPSHCDADIFEEKTGSKTSEKQHENKESRKKLILGLFNKNVPDKSVSQNVSNDTKRSCDNNSLNTCVNHVKNCESNQLLRKNLVLEILKKKNTQDNVAENNARNKNVQKTDKEINRNDKINANKVCTLLKDKINHKITSESNSETKINWKQPSNETSRKQLLSTILKQSSANNQGFKNDSSKNNPPRTKPAQVQPNKKMTLIRKFPGPAGLLPDDTDISIANVSYLNSLEENERTSKEPESDNLTEYCSQTTKNLFTEGAWQLMLDDLPNGLLKGHDIATVKRMATLNGFNGTKVEFLAGIVEHIDFNHDNPPIVLKDFTDNIQGIVHKDIPLKYPGLLEANVVVLLHDVGLLRTSGTFVSNKYRILISPSSLLAIYTSRGVVEHTEHMESAFKGISEGKLKKEEKAVGSNAPSKLLNARSTRNAFQLNQATGSNNKEPGSSKDNKKDTNISTRLNDTNKTKNESFDFDTTDVSFSVSLTKITDSQNEKIFNNSTSKNSKSMREENNRRSSGQSAAQKQKSVHGHKNETADNLLKNLNRFALDTKEKKRFSYNSKILPMDAEYSSNVCSKEDESILLSDVLFDRMDLDKETIEAEIKSPCRQIKQERNKASVRSKLLQFKSVDALTLPECSTIKQDEELAKKKSHETSNSMSDILDDTENDSDDEMLSQLDMDTIFSNYNKPS